MVILKLNLKPFIKGKLKNQSFGGFGFLDSSYLRD